MIDTIRPASGAELPMMAGVAEILALIGNMDEANQIARGFRILSLDAAISRFRQSLLSVALGDAEGALSFLKLAVEDEEAELVWIGVDPRLDPIREVAGFQALAHKVIPAPQS